MFEKVRTNSAQGPDGNGGFYATLAGESLAWKTQARPGSITNHFHEEKGRF
jgi:hypothetical protein